MKKLHSLAYLFALILTVPGLAAEAEELHPLMTSKYWGNLGVYFSERDFDASAQGGIAGITRGSPSSTLSRIEAQAGP
jgi:hypothetical protein